MARIGECIGNCDECGSALCDERLLGGTPDCPCCGGAGVLMGALGPCHTWWRCRQCGIEFLTVATTED